MSRAKPTALVFGVAITLATGAASAGPLLPHADLAGPGTSDGSGVDVEADGYAGGPAFLGSGAYAAAGPSAWDYSFGGIPNQAVVVPTMGFSGIPRVEYSTPIAENMALGGAFAMDIGYYTPEAAVSFGMLLTAPFRLSLVDRAKLTGGLRLEPGFGFFFEDQFRFAILMNAAFNIGYRVAPNLVVGGGVDLPIGIQLDPFVFALPILFGPVMEVEVSQDLHLVVDFKLGPSIAAVDGGSSTNFGMKLNLGVAFAI